MLKTIIIGDVHGCYKQLARLMRKVRPDWSQDRVIFLGDLMDRGPQSWEVFDLVRKIRMEMGERCILLKGNHEQMMLDAEGDRMMMNLWYANGGEKTVRSFQKHRDQTWKHRGWFEQMKRFYETEEYLCVHGGVGPGGGENSDEDTLLWDRSMLEGNYCGKLVVIGHTPILRPFYLDGRGHKMELEEEERYLLPKTGCICLDTGCVFGGYLTAMTVEEGGFWVQNVKKV